MAAELFGSASFLKGTAHRVGTGIGKNLPEGIFTRISQLNVAVMIKTARSDLSIGKNRKLVPYPVAERRFRHRRSGKIRPCKRGVEVQIEAFQQILRRVFRKLRINAMYPEPVFDQGKTLFRPLLRFPDVPETVIDIKPGNTPERLFCKTDDLFQFLIRDAGVQRYIHLPEAAAE